MSITVKEVVALYLKHLAALVADDAYSADGAEGARRELELFAARYGSQSIADCKQHDLSNWLADNPQWEAVDTKRRVVSTITACFNWALDEEIIERSPYRRPSSLRGKTAHIRRPATHDEYIRLMRHGSRPLRRALYMLRKTGMRTCEVRNLTWDEVFLDGPSPYLSIARHKTFRTSGKPRMVGLSASTARFLRNLGLQYERRCNCDCSTCQDNISPNVFTNCHGTPWDRHSFARHLRRTAKAIGLDDGAAERISGYGIRHMVTVDAIEAGVSTRMIADQLGHAKTGMIDSCYGSHTRQRVEQEINRKRNKKRNNHGKGT